MAVAATAAFGADVLERLATRYDVAYCLTRVDAAQGRGRRIAASPAKAAAQRLRIRVRQPESLDGDFELGVDTVVVAAYGLMIPSELLDRALWLNVHPSLLPRWRGAAPVERALLAGDTKTGVTIHRTTPELDAGPLAAQSSFPLAPEDDAGAVYARSAALAVELLDGVLRSPDFRPQPEEGVTYAEKLTAEDRELDWSCSPDELLNRIRALSPHIGARGELHGRRVTVWRAHIVDGRLEPLEVQPEGRRRMGYDEFLRGLR